MPMSVDEIIEATIERGHIPTAEEISLVLSELSNAEIKWRNRFEMLEKEGYVLRPRLRPGWTPSWLESGRPPMRCEDGEGLPPRPRLVDAIDKQSGKVVYIKEIRAGSEEHRIAELLRKAKWADDLRNHCVQVLNVFKDPKDPELFYMVMPFLRPMSDPPFKHVKEIMDFTDQILEGLVFLHEKGIAHRDCARANIMMDADAMYPEGFHPVKLKYVPDFSRVAEYKSRTVAGVKYYFVDFGMSSYFPDTTLPRLVTGNDGRDQEPPELSETRLYDPFKLDVFIIGNMLKRDFCGVFSNLDFLEPLTEEMIRREPTHRPSAAEALALWKEMRDTVWTIKREWRPRPRREHFIETIVLDAACLRDLCTVVAKRVVEHLPM